MLGHFRNAFKRALEVSHCAALCASRQRAIIAWDRQSRRVEEHGRDGLVYCCCIPTHEYRRVVRIPPGRQRSVAKRLIPSDYGEVGVVLSRGILCRKWRCVHSAHRSVVGIANLELILWHWSETPLCHAYLAETWSEVIPVHGDGMPGWFGPATVRVFCSVCVVVRIRVDDCVGAVEEHAVFIGWERSSRIFCQL